MDNEGEEQNGKEAPIYISDSDESASKGKAQRLLKAKEFDNNDEKEELRLKALSRRESRQGRMKASQNRRFLRINYLQSDSEDEEEEGEGISLAAIKAKYKALVRGKGPRINSSYDDDGADKYQAQRPRKILRIISDDEEEETTTLKRKADAGDKPTKELKKCMVMDEMNKSADEG